MKPRTIALHIAAGTAILLTGCSKVLETQAVAGSDHVESVVKDTAKNAADTTSDVVITTKVNAELLVDRALSAARIDVDTSNGRVVLRGKAPDAASRERATQVARSVEGVVAVENNLIVDPSS